MCAEFYDSVRDPISVYFTEKIQHTVSHKSVLALFSRASNTKEVTQAARKRKNTEDSMKKMLLEYEESSKRDRKSRRPLSEKHSKAIS